MATLTTYTNPDGEYDGESIQGVFQIITHTGQAIEVVIELRQTGDEVPSLHIEGKVTRSDQKTVIHRWGVTKEIPEGTRSPLSDEHQTVFTISYWKGKTFTRNEHVQRLINC